MLNGLNSGERRWPWIGLDGTPSTSKALALAWTVCLVFVIGTLVPTLWHTPALVDGLTIPNGLLIASGMSGSAAVAAKFIAVRDVVTGKRPAIAGTQASGTTTDPAAALPAQVTAAESFLPQAQLVFFSVLGMAVIALRAITSQDTTKLPDLPEALWALMGISNTVFIGDKLASAPRKSVPAKPQPAQPELDVAKPECEAENHASA